MSYTPTEWYVQAPITQESMNKIEQGIKDAHDSLDSVQGEIRDASTRMNGLDTRIGTNADDIITLRTQFSGMTTNAEDGRKAWAQVSDAITMNGDVVTQSLNDRIGAVEGTLGNHSTEIEGARKGKTNLRAKIDDIDKNISDLSGSVTTIEEKFASAKGNFNTVEDRFTADETDIDNLQTDVTALQTEVITARGVNGISLDGRFSKIELQLDNAKESSAKDKSFESVDARFEELENEVTGARGGSVSIDARLDKIDDMSNENSQIRAIISTSGRVDTLEGLAGQQGLAISTLQGEVVRKVDIVNDANTTAATTDKVLDARMGKTLQDQITTLQQNASSEGDRIDALEAELDMASADGSRRIDLVEADVSAHDTELSNAHDSTANDAQYGSIDARFEAGETKANTLESGLSSVTTLANQLHTDVQTIANELSMIDHGAIVDTNTRIDDLEDTVSSLQSTMGDQADFGDRIVAAETDIDNLQDAVGSLQTTVSGNGGLTERMATAETNITNAANAASAAQTTANNAAATAAAAATQASLNTLAGRVTTLEGKDTVIVSDATFDVETGAPIINGTPSENCDYLIKGTDDKYYYWRYLGQETGWQLISGGGGSGNGTSSGAFAATLNNISNPDVNTDYFVGDNTNGYLHYRFIEGETEGTFTPVLIGTNPANIKRYNISKTLGKKKEYDNTTQTWVETEEDVYYLNLYEFDYGTSNAQAGIDDESMIPIGQIELPQGGGGGGSSANTRVVRITPATVTTVQNDDRIYLRFFYSSVDATGESHEGSYVLRYNNNSIIASGNINSGAQDQVVNTGVWPDAPRPVGFYEIDVTDYCRLGSQTFNLTVTTNGQNIPRAWTVTILELRLESNAPNTQLIEVGNTIQFPYTPYGAMTKTLHVEIDGTEIGTQNLGASVSGTELEYVIPSQSHGAHTISAYLATTLDGVDLSTNPITRDYIWYDDEDEDTPDIVIASPYRDQVIEVEQYAELNIPYSIYNRNSATSTVKYYEGDHLIDTVTVSTNGTLVYAFDEFGNKTLSIVVDDDVSLTFNITVIELPVDVAQVPGAVISFDPTTLSNSSANRLPTWTYNNQTYHMTVSDNFNWSDDISGGGYKEDADGKCFVIKAGTYAYFDYKMFKQAVNNDDPENPVFTSSVFDNGAEMKITFKVAAVRDASAVWFTNVGSPSSNNPMPIGIQLSAHQGWLKTSAADAAEKQAAREGTVASTNSYLYFPYSEEDKIELDISINRTGNSEDFIMSYEDGVPSKAYAYETTEILYHEAGNESIIRIGSDNCDVYVYKFRIYNKALNTSEILRNFIADGKTITEKVNRYNRNSIYYDSTKPEGQQFTPYKSGSAILDPEKLALKMPDVKILMLEAPTFTKSKKTFVKSSLRCIHAEGGTVYPSRGDEDNWFFQNGYHSGQGTTSDNYGQSSRNVDFLFECDGRNRPSDKVEAEEGYVSTLIKGANKSVLNPTTKSWTPTIDAVVETCSGWKNDDAKVSLTSTSVPNNYFNLKVNVASSENVNNALFQKRYNDFLPYISLAKARDAHIKNDMEFVPAILFIRETDTTRDDGGNYTKHLEFNDTEWHFYSLGNIGDSKKTDYTRAYDPTDENEFTVEISDNNTSNSQFQSGVYISNDERIVETIDSGINSMNYIWDLTDEEWNAQRDPTEKEIDHDYRVDNEIEKYEDGTDVENNLTHYILPNGKVYVNYRHRMLSGDPFDGDHTFEFRYASCGDYRDGKIVNPASKSDPRYQQNKAQEKLNRGIIEAFYEWIVTASNSEFVNELAEWCVPEALEYFYAFTHFYTMMDNRAKNTFWHFAKTGTPRIVHHPHPALLHVYTELDNGEYVPTEDTAIDPEKTYYTEYAFDLWAYDMDTAAGIDNNGELIFPYGKEDTDYRQAGVSSSGYVFNGAGSIVWRRLSQSFTSEIADIFDRVNEASCFDAASLITQFDNFQNCFPEEMWRLDIERKYVRTFTGKVYDNCKLADTDGNTKQNTRFLKEMMQGRKKYQRRQWVRDQSVYFGSKYMLSNVRSNTIEMVCYTPDAPLWNSRGYTYQENGTDRYRAFQPGDFTFYGPEDNRKLYKCLVGNTDSTFDVTKWAEGVTPNYQLKIVPYQDMYINVAVGNGNLRTPQRAVAGQEYTIDCTANMNETRVYIYAGSYIQAISGLAPFYIGANIFSSAARLKKLDLGTDNPTYHNTNLKTLTILPNMPILEELNIKNCDNLNTPINLSASNNLKIVEAEGSIIPSLSLPAYTSIETLHLPSTVNILSLQSARRLIDFSMINKETGEEDYSNLINMNITDSDYSTNIDWISIALAALPHLTTLYLQGLKTASVQDITDIEPFALRKRELETQYDDYGNLINKLNLTGLISVIGEWSVVEKMNYETIWPLLTLNVIDDAEHKKVKHKLTYNYEIDGLQHEYSIYVNNNAEIQDIVVEGIIDTPTKSPTAEYTYTFGTKRGNSYQEYTGWRIVGDSMTLYERYRQDGYVPRVTQETFVEPVFTATLRRYDINWFLNSTDTQPIKTESQVLYGGGDSAEAPTVEYIHQQNRDTRTILFERASNPVMVRYDIFNGWNNLPIKINPTVEQTSFDIYGVWIHGYQDLPSIMTDPNTDPIVWLYVYANMTEAERKLYADVGKKITLETGYKGPSDDVKYNGTLLIGDGANYTMTLDNGRTATYPSTARFHDDITDRPFTTQIQPLKLDNDEFTIAIDYAFDADGIRTQQDNYSGSEMVLASCYDRTNGAVAGFKLVHYIDDAGTLSGPRLAFGDTSVSGGYGNQSISLGTTDSASLRNTIVLQHPKGSSILYIYSGINGGSDDSVKGSILTDMSLNSAIQSIEWNNVNTNAYLVFGDIAIGSTSSQSRKGKGIIYWAKYWNYDLGVGECRRMAGWSHEKMTYAIEEYAGMDTKYGGRFVFPSGSMPNVVLTSLTAPNYGNVLVKAEKSGNVTAGTSIQWPGSILQTVANKRIYQSLPIALQSIITKSPVRSRQSVYTPSGFGTGGNYQVGNSEVVISNDYVFIPSSVEMGNTNPTYKPHEAIKNMIWYNAGNTIVHKWNTTSRVWQNDTSNAVYMNLRFPEIAISTDENDIYYNFAATELYPTVYDAIGPSTIKRGDILIYLDVAYIYVLEEDVINGAITCENTDAILDCYGNGGWVQSKMYYLRSPYDNNQTTGAFMCINSNGSLQATAAPPATTGYGLSYSFSI